MSNVKIQESKQGSLSLFHCDLRMGWESGMMAVVWPQRTSFPGQGSFVMMLHLASLDIPTPTPHSFSLPPPPAAAGERVGSIHCVLLRVTLYTTLKRVQKV